METYAAVLTYVIPGFVVLIIIEYIASRIMGRDVVRSMDTISSLSSGMTNVIKDVLGLSIAIISYSWMVKHWAIFSIESTVWLYVVAFILIDFASYWSHRWNHEFNVLWNRHIVHHSSEEYNLSCALRQSISGIIGVYFFLYIPMALTGIPAEVVALLAPIHLFAQFWYHTRLIGKMGILEHILMTPSHHRVHHAINPEYIDRNYSAIFIWWDKMFGTFQEEQKDIPPVYGVKKAVRTWNPYYINWMHFWQLTKDAWRTNNWWDKARIWFMPTGWRPDDVSTRYPISITEDPYSQIKYDPYASPSLKAWSWFQLVTNNLLMFYIFHRIGDFHFIHTAYYLGFIALSIFAYTALMDRDKLAIPMELIKASWGFYLIYLMNGWYDINSLIPYGSQLVSLYMIGSIVASIYFINKDNVSAMSTINTASS